MHLTFANLSRIAGLALVSMVAACSDEPSGFFRPPTGDVNDISDAEVIDGQSDAGCTASSQCATGLVCDNGACLPPAPCTEDRDCPGGFTCEDGGCISVDDRICVPGTERCEQNAVQTCAADGTRYTAEPCSDGVCVEAGDTASCQSRPCTAGETGCVDGSTAYTCSEAGTVEAVACGADETCVAGACSSAACDAGTTRCEGEVLLVCSADGSSVNTVPCNVIAACASSDFGCACFNDACAPRVCAPGSGVCENGFRRACAADGRSLGAPVACGADEICVGGTCIAEDCELGDSFCEGSVLFTCEATGIEATDCEANGASCANGFAGAECQDWICQPNSRTCVEGRASVVVCDENGSSQTTTNCATNQYCSAGVCLNQVCTPNTRTCVGNDVYRCSADGSASTAISRCATDEVCSDGACVSAGECSVAADCPAPAATCEGNVLISYTGRGNCVSSTCDYTSVTRRTNCANSGLVCNSSTAACEAPAGGDCTTSDECDAGLTCSDGACVECLAAADCLASEQCVDGFCQSCSCPPGRFCGADGECYVGDPENCTSDSQCVAWAELLGGTTYTVRCDPEVGCLSTGTCNGGGGGGGLLPPGTADVFGAACGGGLTCESIFDLNTSYIGNNCAGCTPGDDSTCRAGEYCVLNIIPIIGGSNYCQAE